MCQLCGCWYETRKGLSSHARAHLRHIGIPEREIQGSPIDLLYRIMEEDDLKPISSDQAKATAIKSLSRSSSKRPSSLSSSAVSSPIKRPKTSADCTCVLCGEEFESRKGLASHSRSHLNQLGVVDLLGKSSPIQTIQELVNSGMLGSMRPHKPNGAADSSAASSSPASGTFSPAPGSSQSSFPSTALSTSPGKCSSQPPLTRAPKAKKGFRLAVDPLQKRPKLEPVEMEVSAQANGPNADSSSGLPKLPAAAAALKPPDAGKSKHRLSKLVTKSLTICCQPQLALFDVHV